MNKTTHLEKGKIQRLLVILLCKMLFCTGLYAEALDEAPHYSYEKPLSFLKPDHKSEKAELSLWLKVSALAGTAMLLPAMTILGALIANPQWIIIGELDHRKTRIAYIDQTTSPHTIPLTALFSLLGTAPLWGLLIRERML